MGHVPHRAMADDGRIAKLLRSYRGHIAMHPDPWLSGAADRVRLSAPPPCGLRHTATPVTTPPTSATTSLADISPHSLPMVCMPMVPPSLSESEGIHASLPPPPDRCHHHNRCSGALSPPAPLQLSHPAIITSTPPTTTHITPRRPGTAPHPPPLLFFRHRCYCRGQGARCPPKLQRPRDQIRPPLGVTGVPFIETRRSLERAGAPERRGATTGL